MSEPHTSDSEPIVFGRRLNELIDMERCGYAPGQHDLVDAGYKDMKNFRRRNGGEMPEREMMIIWVGEGSQDIPRDYNILKFSHSPWKWTEELWRETARLNGIKYWWPLYIPLEEIKI